MDDSMDVSNSDAGAQQLTRLTLDLRGTRFVIERDTLMNLPESVLLCLFPNGLLLSKNQSTYNHYQDHDTSEGQQDDDGDVYLVDFDPLCLTYVLSFFKQSQDDFYGTPSQPGKYRPPNANSPLGHHYQQSSADFADPNSAYAANQAGLGQNPLLSKQAIIVLREELEYFAIPPKSNRNNKLSTDPSSGQPTQALLNLKQACGKALLERKQIFTALQRNVNKENNLAEQHLIDMLCMSGFDREDTWGFRAVEPNRCCITSIALVLLKTGITHTGELEAAGIDPEALAQSLATAQDDDGNTSVHQGMRIDHHQLATAQKLLLFWRKPARKCWWDGVDIVLPHPKGKAPDSEETPTSSAVDDTSPDAGMTEEEREMLKNGTGRKVRVWARRVWTLELSLI
ncbi:hypothetical protein IE53DRAFT_349276 [Violaceomyces palustris]|uniref:Uncharacterized protein n=1 Tax=Violaceomyces palustris TaxID=1673888 RepID=A0ACD0NNP3_9BASI|nr:hypothetical protein IE53DRAFT_349276 [Violaceomyces palustris]